MTPFERITTQVQAQIPLVRAMEAALGKAAAHKLVREALDKANRAIVGQRGSLLDIETLASEFDELGLKLERTKTCMNGDGMCDFCYHIKPERLERKAGA
jgi:hypothetical protein